MAKLQVAKPSELLEAMHEAADIMLGKRPSARVWYPPATVDMRAIRANTSMSQTQFARHVGFSPSAVREWD